MRSVRYAHLAGRDAGDHTIELTRLYAVVYAEPPYLEGPEQAERFARTFPTETGHDGFALVVAYADTRLVGAAYGWTMSAGRWFSAADHDPPAVIRDAPKLAVMEWIVHPQHRGRGVGRRLIGLLLADRREPWAVLSADPRSAARGMYARSGWQPCGHSSLPWGPAMDLLALPLGPGTSHRKYPL